MYNILNNFLNKSISIRSLVDEVNTDVHTLFDLNEKIRPTISNDRTTKTRITKLANLLFQAHK